MKLAEIFLILKDKEKELKDTYVKRSQSLTDTFNITFLQGKIFYIPFKPSHIKGSTNCIIPCI